MSGNLDHLNMCNLAPNGKTGYSVEHVKNHEEGIPMIQILVFTTVTNALLLKTIVQLGRMLF